MDKFLSMYNVYYYMYLYLLHNYTIAAAFARTLGTHKEGDKLEKDQN